VVGLRIAPAQKTPRLDRAAAIFFSLALSNLLSGDGSSCSNSRHGGCVLATAEMGQKQSLPKLFDNLIGARE
jgi:hypothetical protein